MKLGATVSVSLHTAVLAWALVSIGAPPPLMTIEEQGVEVDLASLSPTAQDAQGETRADFDRKPVPRPTQRPPSVPEARNVGDAKEDGVKSRAGVVTDKVLDTEKTSAAPKAEKVQQAPQVKPEPVVAPDPKPAPVNTTEVATVSEEKVPIVEDPIADAIADAADVPDPQAQPAAIPVPAPAPRERPKPQTASTQERKQPEAEQRQPQRTATSTEETRNVTDRIGQLLNKQEDTASGARRVASTDPSIGNPRAQPGAELTRGEYGALKGRVAQCWSIPTYVEQENLRITLQMRMSPDGVMDQITDILVEGLENPAHVRAVESSLARNLDRRNCDFSDVLPSEKYDTWKDVRVNFSPTEF